MSDIVMKDTIKQSFIQYAGAVLQSRALVDARDMLKPSARQIFYCMNENGFTHNKGYKKTPNAIGTSMKVYIHGDASLEGIIMRSSQQWNMRYPLVEVEGSNGNQIESGNWAAPRYTSSRLTALADFLFSDIGKNTIDEWRNNYDDTVQYPAVLPSKGFYNLVNGTTGIGIGMASNVPQFNLTELNKALIYLLNNPDCDFDKIYCVPDFASGGILMNEKEVKESLREGTGKACIIRSVIDYDSKDNCLVVSQIPPMVYTNTICGQLEMILDSDDNPGIDRFNDLTGKTPNIKIYLHNNVNPQKVMNYLYANTSLQYHYGINLTMLGEKGRFPRTYKWKELLEEHLKHEKEVYRRGFEFDLDKIEKRLHIIDGLLKAIDAIDEVVKTIKSSKSTNDANDKLCALLSIDSEQAKAILDIKLSRLAHMEIDKLISEKNDLTKEQNRINTILNDVKLFNKEIENGFLEVAKKFGDARRTIISKATATKEEEAVAEIIPENCVVIITENGNIKRVPAKSYKPQRRNGRGIKNQEEAIKEVIHTNTIDHLLVFTSFGKAYRISVDDIPESTNAGKGISIINLVATEAGEKIVAAASMSRGLNSDQFVWFFTKNGMVKKTALSEYASVKRKSGILATNVHEDDKIVKVFVAPDNQMIIFTKNGMSLRFDGKTVNATSRTAGGVKAITLGDRDNLVDVVIVEKDKSVFIATKNGQGKRVSVDNFIVQTRAGKGVICFKGQEIIGAELVEEKSQVLVIGTNSTICITINEVPVSSRAAQGVSIIKNSQILNIVRINE